jgi:hypothetical protein
MSKEESNEIVSSPDKVGAAVSGVLKILEGLSNRERTDVLKAVGGISGLKVAYGTPPLVVSDRSVSKPKGLAHGRKAPPEVKKLREEIKEINSQIKSESSKAGKRLSADHDLIVARSRLFRALKEHQGQKPNEKGASSQSPQSGAPVRK